MVLHLSAPSASRRCYHIIISPNSRKSLDDCDVGRKQGRAMNGPMKTRNNNNNVSLGTSETRGRGKAPWQTLCVFVVIVTKVVRQKLNNVLSAIEILLARCVPAASVSSLARLTQRDFIHAIVDVAWWKHNETKLHFPWHQGCIVGRRGSRCWVRGNSTGDLNVYSWESKDKVQPCGRTDPLGPSDSCCDSCIYRVNHFHFTTIYLEEIKMF